MYLITIMAYWFYFTSSYLFIYFLTMKSCFLNVKDHQKMAARRHFTLENVAVTLQIESNIS